MVPPNTEDAGFGLCRRVPSAGRSPYRFRVSWIVQRRLQKSLFLLYREEAAHPKIHTIQACGLPARTHPLQIVRAAGRAKKHEVASYVLTITAGDATIPQTEQARAFAWSRVNMTADISAGQFTDKLSRVFLYFSFYACSGTPHRKRNTMHTLRPYGH